MLNSIIETFIGKIRSHGNIPVYSAFSSAPADSRYGRICTFVGAASFETAAPIYSPITIFLPFKADIEIKISAAADISAHSLYCYFEKHISPALTELSGLGCRLKDLKIMYDSNIDRLVLTAITACDGMIRIGREETGNDSGT